MQTQPESKWNLVKASILVAFALTAAGIAVSVPRGTPAATQLAAVPADDKPPFIDDFVDASVGASASRERSLLGVGVAADADPGGYDIETF